MDYLSITQYLAEGSPGVDDDPNNPLARGLDRLIRDGKPLGKISLCFLDPDTGPGIHEAKWVGVFVFSAGDQLVYFPGFGNQYQQLQISRHRGRKQDRRFNVDHVTLEKSLVRWHITSPKSLRRQRGFGTADLGSGRHLWFGMSLNSFDVLREVKSQTVVGGNVPESDSKRRLDTFMQARSGVEFPCIKLDPDAQDLFKPGFPHLSLIVGPCGFRSYGGEQLGFPHDSPYVIPPLPNTLPPLPLRSQRASLPSKLDIEIISSWLPGRLTVPISFTS